MKMKKRQRRAQVGWYAPTNEQKAKLENAILPTDGLWVLAIVAGVVLALRRR